MRTPKAGSYPDRSIIIRRLNRNEFSTILNVRVSSKPRRSAIFYFPTQNQKKKKKNNPPISPFFYINTSPSSVYFKHTGACVSLFSNLAVCLKNSSAPRHDAQVYRHRQNFLRSRDASKCPEVKFAPLLFACSLPPPRRRRRNRTSPPPSHGRSIVNEMKRNRSLPCG